MELTIVAVTVEDIRIPLIFRHGERQEHFTVEEEVIPVVGAGTREILVVQKGSDLEGCELADLLAIIDRELRAVADAHDAGRGRDVDWWRTAQEAIRPHALALDILSRSIIST